MEIYSLLNRQARGGIELNHVGPYYSYWGKGYEQLPAVAGGGGLADGYWQQENRKVFINQIEIPARTSALNVARVTYEYAHRILHEFFHVAGSNSLYYHDIMDASARALGYRSRELVNGYVFSVYARRSWMARNRAATLYAGAVGTTRRRFRYSMSMLLN